MTAEALSIQGESPATGPEPVAAPAPPRWPQLMPIAQLVAVVLAVFAIIWNQQQTTDSLRTEMRAEIIRVETTLRAEIANEIGGLRAEIANEIGGLRAEIANEIGGLRAEIGELRLQVAENGERLARIEGFLGIGIPDPKAEPSFNGLGGPVSRPS